ncbi:MAG: transcription antitermination factor NusB [Anaerolineae bacterium]|nr:transcription antitermination factor NusB [Anaerolineae bacterium]MDW8297729.1 transcription antitermination factor NusB [Anaerolineae bacterium]
MARASIQRRRLARIIALQALYELDCTDHAVESVLGAHLEALAENGKVPSDLRRYVYRLVNGVRTEQARLDSVIERFAPEFPIAQMALIDRNLLRIALYEFGLSKKVPYKVAISEAVELAKLFGAENTARFVNGVLGTLVERKAELRTLLNDKATAT